MIYAFGAAGMRGRDRAVIDGLGLPGVVLMELASRAVAEAVRREHPASVAVVCGSGNNGGDGWGAARWLHGWGIPAVVWPVGTPKPGTDAAIMAEAARRAGVREVSALPAAAWLVDAVFGTGLDREIGPPYASAIEAMNAHGAPIVAVDLPSGLDADSGRTWGVAVGAARTVTFGGPKLGMYLRDGPGRCGVVEVADIGLDAGAPRGEGASAQILEDADVWARWPARPAAGHKRSNGHLLVIAGSADLVGAAILVCRGALAGGVGLLTLAADPAMRPRLAGLPPEVMLVDRDADGFPLAMDRFDAVAIGPGWSGGHPLGAAARARLAAAWTEDERPWVADADALPGTVPSGRPRVLTPHPGEAGRLVGTDAAGVEVDRIGTARKLEERGVVLLKGPRTIVCARGELVSLNPTGAPVLATGGSGDVLTGLVGALLARGLSPFDAARVGAYVHGRAGEVLWAQRRDGWTASDVAAAIPQVLG